MKQPKLQTIPDASPDTSFSEQTKAVKKKAANGETAVKRSFSLHPADVAYIDKIALDQGQKRGKSMSASEALRHIIAEHRGQS